MLEREIVHIHLQTTKKRQYYAGKKKCRLQTGSAVACNSRYCSLKEKNASFLITPLMPFSTAVLEKLGDFPLRISVTRQQLFQK